MSDHFANLSKLTLSAGLQLKIVAEDKVVDGRIADFLSEWDTNKYVYFTLYRLTSQASARRYKSGECYQYAKCVRGSIDSTDRGLHSCLSGKGGIESRAHQRRPLGTSH